MSARIEVVEVGPRDGLQNEQTVLGVDARVALIDRLVGHGLRRIESVSFVRPDRVPQMAGAEEVMAQVATLGPDVSHIGLVLNRRGAERAVETACAELNVVVPVTDDFSTKNQNATVDVMIGAAADSVAVAREAGRTVTVTLAVAFGCPFSGEVSTEQVRAVYDRVADLGVDEIAFADTIGVGVPRQVKALAALAADDARVPRLRFHFHNTRNSGYANAYAVTRLARPAGAPAIALDASVGGFGGCPFAPAATGNIATEDLVYLLRREGVDVDGLDVDELAGTGHWLADQLASPVQGLLAKAGDFGRDSSA